MNDSSTQLRLLLAWLISLVALAATLYSSEINNLPVCHLCWYQRICMYPLVVILAVASFKNQTASISSIIALPVIGALFALYQYLEQMIPGFDPIKICQIDVPCSTIHLQLFGFITYPFLSMIGFIVIFILLISCRHKP